MEKKETVVFISKQGVRTIMPSLAVAKERADGIWKEVAHKIEVTTVYKIKE